MKWQSVYEMYPVNQNVIWLNNCGTVPAGKHIVEKVCDYLEGYSQKGVLTDRAGFSEVKHGIKNTLSSLIGCESDELGLIHHTAEGMNIISHGIDMSEGDEVVLLENEYPSNVYPWRRLTQKGVKLVTTPMEIDPALFFEKLRKRVSARTRVISISAVHWCTGMPLPLKRVGALCRKKGIELVVDGAQGVGMQPLDVKEMNISFMAFSAWKWLMGPLGLGILYVSKEKLEALKPEIIGTGSVVRDREYLPYKTTLKPSADRFTISTPNFTDWVYFLASLEFLEGVGFERCMKRIYELTDMLNRALRKTGCSVFSDRFPDCRSGITVFEAPGENAGEVVKRLEKNGVIAAERLGRVRLSPHIYLLPEQLDRAVELIAD